MLTPLPIDPLLPEIVSSLGRTSSLVLEAPPGAGKTTRVPRALLDAGVEGEILVLEPRRLAARMAARRVAEELGERVGERIGYRVRFDDAVSARTRVVFVTEGVLTRRLLSDPELKGVGAVLLDEFHERHLQGDVALALLRRLQERRNELKLVVMSATLEAEPVAAFLGCPSLRAEGRRFDVTIEYATRPTERPLESDVAAAVRKLVADGLDGDVLVFLPGAAEIRKAQSACAGVAAQAGLDVVMLHGDLKPEDQDRAVSLGPRRKVILSTNVAETSITVEGVVAVIDSGLARVASFSPWSGVPTLKVQRISRASATQRAGRAGRLRPGRCVRLYSQHDHDTRPVQDVPEVRRLDLADAMLLLAGSGVRVDELSWLEAPPVASVEAARTLLTRLGALDGEERVTPLGRRMMRFPLHPRQARMVVEAESRGVGREGCIVAALVGERDLVWQRPRRAELSGDSDLLADLDRFAEASRGGLQPDRARSLGLDAGAALTIDRVRRQLEPLVDRRAASVKQTIADADEALRMSILAGYPDRVARRRRQGQPELLMSAGGTAQLSEASVVRDAQLMVIVDVEQRSDQRAGAVVARSVTAIEADWLIDIAAERMRDGKTYEWNAAAERVEVVERMSYDQLVLDERRAWPSQVGGTDPEAIARTLFEAARARGRQTFVDAEELERLVGRVAFVRVHLPEAGLPEVGEAELDAALLELCQGRDSIADLRDASFLTALVARLGPSAAGLLAKEAPDRISLPGGRQVRVQYPTGQAPFVASRLQDFFGMAAGPSLARGRVPLTLHLLAPNQRAVQVTSDLAGFWERHYPAVRRELGRRYPRHSWPDDPLHAEPPAPRPPRRR
ncbi:MAG: ATP-dependent helicase HrpB [Myxococcales bacterium]|nr:ATP-dependent helicase HrpB [Myxococcales bacterium]